MKQRTWKVLLVTAVAVFMAFLDVTIVNVAFPDIRASFPGTSLAELSWVLNAYNIVFAALLVPAGRLADLLGPAADVLPRRARCSSPPRPLCGLAPSVEVLVAARVVQAAGAALLVPTSLALLLPEFPLEQRATATALWGAAGGVAAATGPSLGGAARRGGGLAAGLLRQPRHRRCRRWSRRGGCCARAATRTGRRCRTSLGDRAARRRRRRCSRWRSSRAGLGLGQRARGRLARRGRASCSPLFVVRSARHPAPGDRARAVPRALVRGRERGRVRSSRSASTRCCWPTSCSSPASGATRSCRPASRSRRAR